MCGPLTPHNFTLFINGYTRSSVNKLQKLLHATKHWSRLVSSRLGHLTGDAIRCRGHTGFYIRGSKQTTSLPITFKISAPPLHYPHHATRAGTAHSSPHSITIKVPTPPHLTSQPMSSALSSDLRPMIDMQSNSKPRLSFLFIFIFRNDVHVFSKLLLSTVGPYNLQLQATNFIQKTSAKHGI